MKFKNQRDRKCYLKIKGTANAILRDPQFQAIQSRFTTVKQQSERYRCVSVFESFFLILIYPQLEIKNNQFSDRKTGITLTFLFR